MLKRQKDGVMLIKHGQLVHQDELEYYETTMGSFEKKNEKPFPFSSICD